MKQLAFMLMLTLAGATGAVIHPFYGILLYYTLAVLRPQLLWDWALPQDIRWSLIAVLITMGGMMLAMPRKNWRLRFNGLAAMIIAFALLVMISVVMALDPHIARAWVSEYGKVFVVLIVATLVIDRLRHIQIMAWMILLCIGYVAWEMNSRYVFDGQMDILTRGFAGFDNNGAGLLMAIGLPFAYALARLARQWWVRLGCLASGLLMMNAMMLSFSRGAMISALAGLGWLLSQHRPRSHAIALAVLLVLGVGALAGPEVRQRFLSITEYQNDQSATNRLKSWAAAWHMAWDHPFTGVGVRNSNHFAINYGSGSAHRTTHNHYLQIASDSGIPAALLYLFICGWALWRLQVARRMTGNGRQGPEDDLDSDLPPLAYDRPTAVISLGIQGALVTFMVGGVFLSLELFELPWLLIVMAGALPGLIRETHQLTVSPADPDETPRQATASPTPLTPRAVPLGGLKLVTKEFAG